MPDLWMDVDVNLSEVPVNILPLIDDTDFKSIEGAVAYNAAGMALRWHFVTTAGAYTVTSVTPTTGGDYDWTDQGDAGIYTIEIPASGGASINNDTEGFGWFTGVATGILPWRGPTIGFRRAALNDLLIDGGTASTNLEDFFDGTGYAGGTIKLGVNLVQILGTALTETAGQIAAAFKKFFDVATPTGTVNSLPGAVPGAAGGVFIAGTNAPVTITGSGNALTLTSTGANGHGLAAAGNGSGHGIAGTGGATGNGIRATGGGTSGAGLYATASGASNYGIEAIGTGGTDSGGIKGTATTAGEGLEGIGGGNGHGLFVQGAGTGEGLHATAGAGANAHGAHFEGVGANSSGVVMQRGGAGGDDLNFANNDVTINTVTNLTNAPTNGDLTATMKASVNAEIVDTLATDTYAEPGQATPGATLSLAAKIGYLFKAWRNRVTQTATTYSLYNDDAATVDQKATVSDNGATFDKGEITTGP